jgi:tetratricopeptide (TPR) repeat protein
LKALSFLISTVLAWSAVSGAFAQSDFDDQRARSHFEAGTSYFQESRFEDAAREFQEAYRLSQRSMLLINIGLSFGHALKFDEAITAYQKYLETEPDAANRSEIEARIEHLRKMSQQVRVAEEQESTEVPDETDQPQELVESEPVERQSERSEQSEVARPTASSSESENGGGSILPWVIGGIGVALIAAGSVTGALTLSQQSELDDTCSETRLCPPSESDNIDTAQTLALVTDILLGTGIAALVTGAVLLLVMDGDADSDDQTETAFACSADGCLGTARLRF